MAIAAQVRGDLSPFLQVRCPFGHDDWYARADVHAEADVGPVVGGAALGALIGALAGPVGVAIGLLAGGALGNNARLDDQRRADAFEQS